jgi:PAS domain S-box-containing protein
MAGSRRRNKADAAAGGDASAVVGSALTHPTQSPLLADGGSALYRLLVESVRDYAIFALDASGHVLTWNIGAERFKGYTAHEIIGQHFSTFYPEERRAAAAAELDVAVREGRFEEEGWRVRKDGSTFWASVIITPLFDPAGELVGFAKVTRDLTERRAAQLRAIEDARRLAEADAANRTKGQFLAAMSHELRTPLNAISGYADLLTTGIGGGLSAQQLQFVERIRGSQEHLLAIINDILNFSRIEAGQVSYARERVSLAAVTAAVLPFVEPQAAAKSIRLVHRNGEDVTALADRVKVEQIMLNLLSNAIKFTGENGEIEVQFEASGERASIQVRDNGIGIEPDEIDRIFEPFVQVGRSLTSHHQGAGLGLAISRDLARAMGGDLEAESAAGAGAAFTLTLPLA